MSGSRRFILPGDRWVLDHVRGFDVAHRPVHDAVVDLSDWGIAIVVAGLVVAVAALAVRSPARRRPVVWTLAAAGVAYACTVVLKPAVDRAPPYASGRLAHGQALSPVFPEGPGALAIGLAVGLWDVSRPLSLAAAGVAVGDGLVQVGMGSHWPSDVLAAWVLGAASGLAGRRLRARGASRG